MNDVIKIILAIIVIAFVVIIGPLLTIWAGNEIGQYLWPDRQVPYNVWTWLAVVIIGAFIKGKVSIKK